MGKIRIEIPVWNTSEMGYEQITNAWDFLSIADAFGIDAVKQTLDSLCESLKDDYKQLTELVLVCNHKSWQHYDKNDDLSRLYADKYYEYQELYDSLYPGDKEQSYYFKITD